MENQELTKESCVELLTGAAELIPIKLEEKYDEMFTLDLISGLINRETITAVCHSVLRPDLSFVAELQENFDTLIDFYPERRISRQVEDLIIAVFKAHEKEVALLANPYRPKQEMTEANLSLAEYIALHQPEMFVINAVLPERNEAGSLSAAEKAALLECYEQLNVPFDFKYYMVCPDQFESCAARLRSEPYFNETILELDYSASSRFAVRVDRFGLTEI